MIDILTHYLDDFWTAGPGNSAQCASNLAKIRDVFNKLGVPIAPDKLEGPTTCITYLGIEMDSVAQVIRLPPPKFQEVLLLLSDWATKKKCTKRELLSLIGKLAFAAKVVRSGRLFLRRLIDLSTSVTKLHHHITLNLEARKDIRWWSDFLPTWNGISIIPDKDWSYQADLEIFTDAASTLGYGAYYHGKWFYGPWPAELPDDSIQWKELFSIDAACKLWGPEWRGKKIIFRTDNETNVAIWSKQSSKSPHLMNLICKIFLITATYDFQVSFKHIPGICNAISDALSRLQVQLFRQLAPQADPEPTELPRDIWQDL